MKNVLFSFLLLFSFSINAQVIQQWVAKYNGPASKNDGGNCIAVDKQGNVYVTGFSTGTGLNDDYLTVKYNSEGVEQWTARYNGPDNKSDDPTSLAIDNNGNVYVTGYSYGNTYADYATVKYNSAGVEQWVARYNGTGNYYDEAYSIAVDKDGNVYVTGDSWGGSSGYDYVTIKYNPAGVQMWVSIYDGPGNSSAVVVKTDDAANVYVTGYGTVTAPNQDIVTIKYSSAGTELWVKRFDGPTNSVDAPNALAVDNIGDVYVCGFANTSATTTANYDFVTVKYNGTGDQEWVRYYNGTVNANDVATSVAIDITGNIIVTGSSPGSGSGKDIVTIKYNPQGVQQWTSRYNGTGNSDDWPNSVITDTEGNSYVTGATKKNGYQDYITIKYNPEGAEVWVAIYNGPGNRDDCANASTIDDNGNLYVTGFSYLGTYDDYTTIKYSQESKLSITKPVAGSKFIAGQKDTIRWKGEQAGQVIKIEYSADKGNTYNVIVAGVLSSSKYYSWDIPEDIMTTKAKIRITDFTNEKILDESGLFGIKPYVLTRLNEDSTYYVYRKERDQWGFRNTEIDMWPQLWYNQFNYHGTDPFTAKQYPQALAGGIFASIYSDRFPDWISWVNTFSIKACYLSIDPPVYSQTALLRWNSSLMSWHGSCFGIAATNALAFSHKEQFKTKFPNLLITTVPIEVTSNDGVKNAVGELFTQQFGKPSTANDLIGNKKTPYQTLQDIKQMLIEDNGTIKTLTIFNNGGKGGHTILAYGLKQDPVQNNIYNVQVYDNSNPNSNNPITFDLLANGGNGSWSTPDWSGWGGNKGIYLEVVSDNYFNNATKGKNGSDNYKSPFIFPDDRLEINNNPYSDIRISNLINQITGCSNNTVLNEIPNSIPLTVKNGSETPPYGYSLPTDVYNIVVNNFHSDTINTFFFTGNKSYLYQRNGATQTQTDRFLFNGEVHVINNDNETKTFSLLSLINETSREKLCIFRSLKTAANEDVAIGNPDSNKIKISTYFTAQHYDIELTYLTNNGIGKFAYNNITLPENSSHIIVPDWTNLTDAKVMVLVDLNNDLTIDDTLYFSNLITGIGNDEDLLLLHQGFYLSQNYPNPFDANTLITYQLPTSCKVTLKVFDLIGNEVATLVNENKPAGEYKAEFNASHLKPGMYFYKLQTGNFLLTKKMMLRR
jgi:uncharacterized delta-60 repeat protein